MTDAEILDAAKPHLDAITELLKKRTPPNMPVEAPTKPGDSVSNPLAGIVIPGSYDDLYKHYGDPKTGDFAGKFITTVSHEVSGKQTGMQVHVVIAPLLHAIWADMNAAGLTKLFKEFDGGFVVRDIRGAAKPSLHSWGLALDFNATDMPLGSLNRWPDSVTAIWHKYGFVNGQDFNGRKDPMHFQFTKPHSI